MAEGSGPRTDWLDRSCIVIPAYEASATLATVIRGLREAIPERANAILVIDDGSLDGTREIAEALGVITLVHEVNRGKGAALRTGFIAARDRGWEIALTVDADDQHPAAEARRVLLASPDPEEIVLGVRNLDRDGAPKANRVSNGISNFFISQFSGRPLRDTQCGLRRYPVSRTLALGTTGQGYDFEAEVLLRAAWSGAHVVEQPVAVRYPHDRTTHFHVVRDPWRIIRTVVSTLRKR